MRPLIALAFLVLPACHLGPYYDVHEFTCGPDLARADVGAIRPHSTTAAEVLESLGPPQRVERRGARTFFTWLRQSSDQENFGFGVGALSLNLQVLDVEYRAEPTQSITAVVENDRVVAFGRTITPAAK